MIMIKWKMHIDCCINGDFVVYFLDFVRQTLKWDTLYVLRSNFCTYRTPVHYNKSFCTSGVQRSAKVSTFLTLDVGNAHLILFRVPKNSQTSWFHDVAGTKHSAIRVEKKCKFCEKFFGSYLGLNQSYV